MTQERNTLCPNCENNFNNEFEFCPHCGQKNKKVKLDFKYLVNDFLSGSFNIDSKFFTTFRFLIAKPAYLTKEFLSGKRTKYITPLRIYLLVSLVYFFVLSLSDESILKFNDNDTVEVPVIYNTAEFDSLFVTDNDSLNQRLSKNFSFDEGSVSDSTFLGIEISKLISLNTKKGSNEFKQKLHEYMSVAMFFIMPIAALFLFWFFGKGTYYLEHLIFTIHLQSLVFLIMSIFGIAYYFLPYEFIDSIKEVLIIVMLYVWIKSFYNFKWFKSFFATILFFVSYVVLLLTSFVILAWFSLLSI